MDPRSVVSVSRAGAVALAVVLVSAPAMADRHTGGAGAGPASCPGPRTSFRTSACRSTSAARRSPATPDTCAAAAHFLNVAVSTSSTALKINA